jgi:hypothetical protein
VVAVTKERCVAMAGTLELPFEGGRPKKRNIKTETRKRLYREHP